MLALLQFLQNLIGKRSFQVMAVITVVAIAAVELTSVFRNYLETYIQKQTADQSAAMQLALQQEKTALAIKAAEDAKRAAADAQNAEAIARESTLRQEAERREKQALADKADADRRNAEAIARESTLRQEAERREKQALADKADADRRNAEAVANNSEDMQRALADKTRAEATKTGYEAIKAQMMACVFDPSACNAHQRKVTTANDVGRRMWDLNQDLQKNLETVTVPPAKAQDAEPPRAAPPPATAQSAKTPPAFDCNKAFYSVEYVICSSPQLMEAEARLEDANNAARAVRETTGQHAWWTESFGQSCGLPAKGRPSPAKISASQNCVADAMNQRIHALQSVAAQN